MLKKILKWCAWIAGSAVTLLLLACTLIVWILTPVKLTPMVEREASRSTIGVSLTGVRIHTISVHASSRSVTAEPAIHAHHFRIFFNIVVRIIGR